MQHDSNLTAERPTFVTHLECAMTGERYPADQVHNLSRAGKPLLVRYDLAGVKQGAEQGRAGGSAPPDLWRYRELLPVRRKEDIVSLGEAMTPLVPLPKLAAKLGGGEILVKDEGRLPTGSFKARGLVMAVSMAKALGIKHMAMPTNGNAGAALAAYATPLRHQDHDLLSGRHAGGECQRDRAAGRDRLPRQRPDRRLRQDRRRGQGQGRLVRHLDARRSPTGSRARRRWGSSSPSSSAGTVPDVIFYPTGGGTGLIGMWKAFAELEAIGFIGKKRPRMVAVQAAGCAPMVRAFEDGVEHAPRWENAHTIASGIRVPQAIGDFLILRAVRESNGFAIAVADEAITAALDEVAREEGF